VSRLPAKNRDQLSPENQVIWDRVMSGRTSGGGPYGIMLHSPALAEKLSAVESYFRHEGKLDTQDKELLILVTARELGARFPWYRHEIRAREAGMRNDTIEALRAGNSLELLSPRERLLAQMALGLLRQRQLSEDLFSRGLAELGPERLVELVGLVSHYNLISSVANVFGLPAPEGRVTF